MSDHSVIGWLVEPLQYQFVCRGLVMSLLLGVGCALVGSVLLLRRMALAADSFGHALLPGVTLRICVLVRVWVQRLSGR